MRIVCCLVVSLCLASFVKASPVLADETRLQVSSTLLESVQVLKGELSPEYVNLKALRSKIERHGVNNIAERYLKHFALGQLALLDKNYQQAIKALEQAKTHSEELPELMKAESVYYDFNRVLADAYLAVENYELAYHHRRTYLIAYADEFEAKEKAALKSLEQKYQVDQKEQLNLLLEQQAKLKQAQISQLKQAEQYNDRNVLIFIGIGVVFILMSIRQLSVRQKLRKYASTDMLTGLLNRAALFVRANKLIRDAKAKGYPLSVLVIDIDYFKQVNDDFGHIAGDRVLKKIALLGLEVMRSRDVFARLGGEEFVAVLPQATLEEAKAIALHLKEKVAAESFGGKGQAIDITLSIGAASLSQVKPNVESIVRAADVAMYHAKNNGRNQVVTYCTDLEQNNTNMSIS